MRKITHVFPTPTIVAKTSSKSSAGIAKARRENPPKVFLRLPTQRGYYGFVYVPARWRIKGGYVHLQWREGKRVRTWYIGKAKKSFPTPAIAGPEASQLRPQKTVGKEKR